MWILSSDGDFLKGKSIWLRPGKKYLFGRVTSEGSPPRNYGVDHKSISRKHLVIEVAPVKAGDAGQIHARSQVSIQDQGSKIGTRLDGQKVQAGSRILDNQEHVIKLGNYEHVLRIKWHPVVITYSTSAKGGKGKDPPSAPRSRLEDLDIKTIDSYATDFTTHVLAPKRNTPRGLQALINGKYIVTDSYIDAVVYAATPEVLDSPESLSPLEQDFDGAWPDPLKHLPPKGKEPTDRPATAYAPDENRIAVFQFYTFVFSDRSQFDTLQPPISNGHGKALLYEAIPGRTTIDEFMQYIKSVADDKGLDGFGHSADPGGVVVVSHLPKGHEKWANKLYQEVAIRMDQRCAAQNEFLEAILANDASFMKRALEGVAATPSPRGPPSTTPAPIKASHSSPPHQQLGQVEDSQPPPKRTRTRLAAAPRIKAFDDGFDMDSLPNYDPVLSDHDDPSQEPTPNRSFSAASNVAESQTNGYKNQQSKKRPHPDPVEDDEDDVNSLLPAATAMKRRRLEIERENRRKGIVDETSLSRSQLDTSRPAKKSRPKRKEIDVIEAARERREAQEAAARQDRENLEAEMEGMDVEAMRNLAVVEEMEVPERRDRPTRANGENSGRWDERWNGRKNFKKFRRARDAQDGEGRPRQRMLAVFVPLVEVRRKDFGIGEEYWPGGGDGERRREKERSKEGRRREKERRSQNVEKDESDPGPLLRASGSASAKGKASNSISQDVDMDDEAMNAGADVPDPPSPSFTTARTRLEEEAASIVGDEAIDVDQPRTTRAHDREKLSTSPVAKKAGTASKGKGKGKRVADEETGRTAKAKKAKSGGGRASEAINMDEDSDEGDGLKFRFKRKR